MFACRSGGRTHGEYERCSWKRLRCGRDEVLQRRGEQARLHCSHRHAVAQAEGNACTDRSARMRQRRLKTQSGANRARRRRGVRTRPACHQRVWLHVCLQRAEARKWLCHWMWFFLQRRSRAAAEHPRRKRQHTISGDVLLCGGVRSAAARDLEAGSSCVSTLQRAGKCSGLLPRGGCIPTRSQDSPMARKPCVLRYVGSVI